MFVKNKKSFALILCCWYSLFVFCILQFWKASCCKKL